MIIDTPDPTLAALANLHPGAPRVLEAFHLDYCCGGAEALSAACHRAGLDPQHVRRSIESLGEAVPVRWDDLSPSALVDHIEMVHHRHLDAELPRLQALVDKVAAAHAARHPELSAVVLAFGALRDDLEPHLLKEERALFPVIRAIDRGDPAESRAITSLRAPISCMLLEHGRAGELLGELCEMTDGYRPPEDACASYQALYSGLAELEADTHLHIHKENNVLFPAALALEHNGP